MKNFLLGLFLSALSMPVLAQAGFELGVDLVGGFPRDQLEDVLDDDGFGFTLRGGFIFDERPFTAGLEFTGIRYGRTTGDPLNCCPDLQLRVDNEILMGHVFLRWEDRDGWFRPYLEGLVGAKEFQTESEFITDSFDEGFDERTEIDDTAFSYGTGFGFGLVLREGRRGPDSGPEILLDFNCKYLHGDVAEYVPEDTVTIRDTAIEFAVFETETDLLTLDIGLSFRF